MNVLYVVTHVSIGGATQSLIDLLSVIRKSINPILVIPQKGYLEDFLISNGYRYYCVPFKNVYGKIDENRERNARALFINNYETARILRDIIKKERIDLIHINSSSCYVGAIAALQEGIPYVWHVRELFRDHFGMDFYDPEITRKLMERSGALIAVSNTVRDRYYEEYNLSSIRLYNGISESRYFADIRDSFPPCFLIVGNVTEEKGQLDAVAAVRHVVDVGYKDVQLEICGYCDDVMQWKIQKYISKFGISENVRILSETRDLRNVRNSAGYAIITSNMEALGRATIESMYAGLYIIGIDNGGTKELIGVDGSKGLLYKAGDVYDLANKMIEALCMSYQDKKTAVRNAQVFSHETFDINHYVDNIHDIYRQVMKKKESKEEGLWLSRIYENYKKQRVSDAFKDSSQNDIIGKAFAWGKSQESIKSLKRLLIKSNSRKIGIYGLGKLGSHIYDVIEEAGYDPVCIIDRNKRIMEEVLPVYTPSEKWPDTDIIVVCVINEENEILDFVRGKIGRRCIGIKELYLNEGLGEKYNEN